MSTTLWNIDGTHSSINFSIRHMVISKVRGRFASFTGTLNLDDGDIARSVVEATLDATSIDTGMPQRDTHLRSPDFFDAEKFPELTFRNARVVAQQGTDFTAIVRCEQQRCCDESSHLTVTLISTEMHPPDGS